MDWSERGWVSVTYLMSAPVEITLRYATTVDDLPAAWAFVMARLDGCGPAPSVDIKPLWTDEDDFRRVRFSVVVAGMNEEGDDDAEGRA